MNEQAARAQARFDRLESALRSLVDNPQFEVFIDEVRALKEIAVREACNDANLANPERTAAAIGSVRAYIDILDIYENAVGPRA